MKVEAVSGLIRSVFRSTPGLRFDVQHDESWPGHARICVTIGDAHGENAAIWWTQVDLGRLDIRANSTTKLNEALPQIDGLLKLIDDAEKRGEKKGIERGKAEALDPIKAMVRAVAEAFR